MYMNKIQKIILPFLALIALIGCTRNLYGVKPSAPGSEEQMVKTVFTRGVNLASCFDVSEISGWATSTTTLSSTSPNSE